MLSKTQLLEWDNLGYLTLRGFYTGSFVDEMRKSAAELEYRPETKGKWMRYYEKSPASGARQLCRIENFIGYSDFFKQMLFDRNILSILSQLLGERACLFKEKINFKMPGANGFLPHQDAPAFSIFQQKYHLNVMFCIDDCTIDNGCVEFAPGRHKEGLFHQNANGDLSDEIVNSLAWRPVEANAGDVLIFDSFIPHRSGPNYSSNSRRVLYATYNRESEGDMREEYYREKRIYFPPEYEREEGVEYSGPNPFNLGNPIK